MNKKVIAIIGLAIVIAVSGGAIALNAGNKDSGKKSADSSSAVSDANDAAADNDQDVNDVPDEDLKDVPDEDDTEAAGASDEIPQDPTAQAAPTSYDGTVEPSVPFDDQIISQTMHVKFVVDNSTGAEASPRVVLGKDFSLCYIAFSPNKTFEMCLDPVSESTRTGTYQIVGGVVSVVYDDDGSGSEYDILVDEEGNITHVIVNYGDYSVYFG